MAQLILFFDPSNQLCAEAPGDNGSRHKIELTADLKLQIMCSALGAELIRQRDRERRQSEANRNWEANLARQNERAIRAQARTERLRQEAETQKLRAAALSQPGLAETKPLSAEHRAESFAKCAINHPRQVKRWFPNRQPGETRKQWQTRVGAVNAKPLANSKPPKPILDLDLDELDQL